MKFIQIYMNHSIKREIENKSHDRTLPQNKKILIKNSHAQFSMILKIKINDIK